MRRWRELLFFLLTGIFPLLPLYAQPLEPTMYQFQTSAGNFTVRLFEERAPQTSDNFRAYIDSGFFADTIFHRVIPGFMIQGGGFDAQMRQQPTQAPIRNEADNGVKNTRGTLAMARTGDPHSATAQFFVNLVDNDFLDHRDKSQAGWGYTVFAEVTEGMEVVDQIAQVPTRTFGPHENVPAEPVVIERVVPLADNEAE